MFVNVKSKISAIILAATVVAVPLSVSADQIALTFETQGITLVGDFAGFNNGAYIILTEGKALNVPAVLVSCEGVDCFEIKRSPVSKG